MSDTRPFDDRSPVHLRRHVQVGYPSLDREVGTYWATTEDGSQWLLSPILLVQWPPTGEPQSWPLVVSGWLQCGRPLDVTVIVAGREERLDLGEVVALAEETIVIRR